MSSMPSRLYFALSQIDDLIYKAGIALHADDWKDLLAASEKMKSVIDEQCQFLRIINGIEQQGERVNKSFSSFPHLISNPPPPECIKRKK
jgi:hypothetical protein